MLGEFLCEEGGHTSLRQNEARSEAAGSVLQESYDAVCRWCGMLRTARPKRCVYQPQEHGDLAASLGI